MNKFHQRKSPRAPFNNYSQGIYFITICTKDKKHLFGSIKNGRMHYTKIGEYTLSQLNEISLHYPYAEIFEMVVMPNHLHFLIEIFKGTNNNNSVIKRTHEPCVPTIRTALSVVIGGLKRSVTVYARRNSIDFEWQSRYHDHIVRDFYDFNKIGEYIRNNIGKWEEDCYNQL